MLNALQDFASSLPDFLQWFGVMLISAVPFIDSYFGSVVGVLIGLPPAVAIGVAVIGNVLSMLGFVFVASGVRSKVVAGRAAAAGAGASADSLASDRSSSRNEKVRRAFDKYGVAGVSLLGPFVLPSQFTSAAMVSFGANRNAVIAWQIVSIVIWGVAAGVAASLGVALVR
ncbi:hypothetical protein PX701_02050 [Agromyces sp. H3Y2-19a]|uniref:hypothetical protein n=1 Tax=Agromyces chromiiresistens TaxID=3030835 RepID=UPI0023B95466|nr:hypothetical protein [Agromyces chromiiresistens]MDF0512395.1 hypothetical protein [Agromyces chromiiresistens]